MHTTLYVGSYPRALNSDTADRGRGISVLRLREGAPAELVQTAPIRRPGWLALNPEGHTLYAVDEIRARDEGEPCVVAFRVDRVTGELTEIGRRATGPAPAHVVVDATGRMLLVPSLYGSMVHVFALEPDGSIGDESDRVIHEGVGADPVRQPHAKPHSVAITADNRFALVPDLGLDRVEVYRIDTERRALDRIEGAGAPIAPGSGARHLVVHPNGRWVFVVAEMAATVTTLALDEASGSLSAVSTVSVLPDDVPGYRSAAEIVIAPSGDHVYVTHRAHGSSGPRPEGGADAVVWFRVDPSTGALTREGAVPSGGAVPRTCLLTGDGRRLLVANQVDDRITVFDVGADGALTATGDRIDVAVPVAVVAVESD